MSPSGLRIGEVAAQARVNIQTLRFYERRGLLEEPERTPAGYRVYPQEAVHLVRFIKHAQELGFTLREVEELLRLRHATSARCSEVKAAAEEKIADIEEKVRQLLAIRRALSALVASCVKNASPECPLLEALEDERSASPRTVRPSRPARRGRTT